MHDSGLKSVLVATICSSPMVFILLRKQRMQLQSQKFFCLSTFIYSVLQFLIYIRLLCPAMPKYIHLLCPAMPRCIHLLCPAMPKYIHLLCPAMPKYIHLLCPAMPKCIHLLWPAMPEVHNKWTTSVWHVHSARCPLDLCGQ